MKDDDDTTVTKSFTRRMVPPDGGWGWFVVLGAFLIHVITDGVLYSFGVIFMELLEYFDGGKGETAWIGSLVTGVSCAVGPIASILTNRYGCRKVTITGTIITAVGFILSIGLGLIHLPTKVCVSYYFEKKRSLAMGLAVCGSGIGTFIFAPITELLVEQYGWKGTTLIQAGIILNCILCGVMYRPLNSYKNIVKEDWVESEPLAKEREANDTTDEPTVLTPVAIMSRIPVTKNSSHFAKSDGALHEMQGDKPPWTCNGSESVVCKAGHLSPQLIFRKDMFLSLPLVDTSQYYSTCAINMNSTPVAMGIDPEQKELKICCCLKLPSDDKYSVRHLMNFSLLRDAVFILIAISNFLTMIGFFMPFIFLVDRAHETGISKQNATLLLSIVGIANTVARIVFGWISDRKGVNRLYLYSTSLVLCGVVTAISPLHDSYAYLVGYSILFGTLIGAMVVVGPLVIIDLLGIDKLSSAFGLSLMFQGIATFIGPPIAGWLYDGTGSYHVSFYVAGTVVAVSGVILYTIPFVKRSTE